MIALSGARALSMLLCLLFAGSAHAASGDLDPRFGRAQGHTAATFRQNTTHGADLVPAANGGWYVTGTALAADIATAGSAVPPPDARFPLRRCF